MLRVQTDHQSDHRAGDGDHDVSDGLRAPIVKTMHRGEPGSRAVVMMYAAPSDDADSWKRSSGQS